MPLLGAGLYKIKPEEAFEVVTAALAAGVRHLDTASAYRNDAEIGAALDEALCSGRVSREELFVTGKLWNSDHGRVREACQRSLSLLGLDCFDLYLVHWPLASGASSGVSLEETWLGMEALQREGLVKAIGVANWSRAHLEALFPDPEVPAGGGPCRVLPCVNQIEAHPGFANAQLVQYCQGRGIHVTAHSCLGGGGEGGPSLLADPAVGTAAEAAGVTPAQLVLRWGLSKGCSVLVRSADFDHLRCHL